MTRETDPSHPVLDPFEALIRLHRGLGRCGPGLEASTLQALAACHPLPSRPTVADLGCGTGAATLPLAKALEVPILAVDACAPFLADLEERARASGLSALVRTTCCDFGHLDLPPASLDLLWSEGAIYHLGWAAGLRAWMPYIRPGGFLALTEAVWLRQDPPAEAVDFWATAYPALTTMPRCEALARQTGLEVVEMFPLPAAAWWEYYAPLVERCRDLEPCADPALRRAIQETLAEVNVFERYGESYGYAFFVLRVPDDAKSRA